jgi:hypothetical protein
MNTDAFSLTLAQRHVEFPLRTNGHVCIAYETKAQEADDTGESERCESVGETRRNG